MMNQNLNENNKYLIVCPKRQYIVSMLHRKYIAFQSQEGATIAY